MKIVIIGSGNTATVLGRKLKAAGHQIVQVYGRNIKKAAELAKELESASASQWNHVNEHADVYLLAVSDNSIRDVSLKLQLPGKIIVHTAASVSKHVLKDASSRYGVFYPLQSLRADTEYMPDIPILIDAGDEATLNTLDTLAHSISDKVIETSDEERLKLHLAAVCCNNFVNHLYVLTENYCQKEGIDFSILIPLIKETAARPEHLLPTLSQTGPAIRNDQQTINSHLAALEKYQPLKAIYELFTKSIKECEAHNP